MTLDALIAAMTPVLLRAFRLALPFWLRLQWVVLLPFLKRIIRITVEDLFHEFSQPAPLGISGNVAHVEGVDPAKLDPALLTAIAVERLQQNTPSSGPFFP